MSETFEQTATRSEPIIVLDDIRSVWHAAFMKTKVVFIRNVQSMPEKSRTSIRLEAYKAYNEGLAKYATATKLHVHERTVGRWYEKFKIEGESAIHEKERGAKAGGDRRKLSDRQLAQLRRDVADKTPDQMKFKFALWSSKAVREYVSDRFGMQISRRTARRYLQKLGFTYKCPIKLAREQDPEKVSAWIGSEYPKIRESAKSCGGTILWADESCVMTSETKARGYSVRGTAPVLRTPANRSIRCNMISLSETGVTCVS